MSTFTRSITFNDQTATISFPTKLNSKNQLDWALSLSSGTNKVSTYGFAVVEPSSPKATTAAVSTGPVTTWPSSITPAVTAEDKMKHVEFIKESLSTVDTATGRDAKAACAKMLFDYLLIWGMDFIKAHERFKLAVIAKAYELKKEAPEKATMVDSMNKVLTALGQPLEKPTETALPASPPGLTRQVACGGSLTYCGCDGCPDLTIKTTTEVKAVTEPSKAANPVVQPASTAKDNSAEYNLFVATAKRMGCSYITKYPKEYFGYYQSTVKRGYIKGSPAQMIEQYLTRWGGGGDDGHQRTILMKQLFEKNKLTFTPDVMTLYDEWQKTYKPVGVSNRYKKMCAFIEANKTLFTAA